MVEAIYPGLGLLILALFLIGLVGYWTERKKEWIETDKGAITAGIVGLTGLSAGAVGILCVIYANFVAFATFVL